MDALVFDLHYEHVSKTHRLSSETEKIVAVPLASGGIVRFPKRVWVMLN